MAAGEHEQDTRSTENWRDDAPLNTRVGAGEILILMEAGKGSST